MNINLHDCGYIRVSSVSPELRVGNVSFNVNKIIEICLALDKEDVQIALFPELSLTGYSCQDLFFQNALLKSVTEGVSRLLEFSRTVPKMVIIIGAPIQYVQRLYNTAVVLKDGRILGIVPKTYLPNTNEYYEKRWFTSGLTLEGNYIEILGLNIPFGTDLIFETKEFPNCIFGIEICQDLWNIAPPSTEIALAGATIILNPSSSDEYVGKSDYRRSLVVSQSGRLNCAYIYADSGPWESTTDVIFSGHCIIAENGKIIAENRNLTFTGTNLIADIDIELLTAERCRNDAFRDTMLSKKFRTILFDNFKREIKFSSLKREVNPTPLIPKTPEDKKQVANEIFELQSFALARRLKYINVRDVVLGLSGGLDSTLALLVSLNTFRICEFSFEGIHPVILPGLGTSKRTLNNALNLARKFNLSFEIIDIRPSVINHFKDIGYNLGKFDIVYENAQARERTQILMDLANKYNGIVVGTGDLSEIALGWSTYNADHMSMYNVNAGVPKTLVRFIIQWFSDYFLEGFVNEINPNLNLKDIKKVLSSVLNTPISPELLPTKGQKITQQTEEIVGPFELNDFFLYYMFRYGFSPRKIFYLSWLAFKGKYSKEEIKKWIKNFYWRFFVNQFKRSCMPDGPKVGTVALSPRGDWRMPSDADSSLWINQINEL
ncbi:MAG: NAD(+) synthase [Candidatus Kapaibacteriales bacterium]